MIQDRSAEERISAWLLGEAPDQLPDRVLQATFERTRPTRRLRALPGWRSAPLRIGTAVIAGGAAAVLVLAIGALVFKPGPSVSGPPSAPPSPTPPGPTLTASPTLAPVTGLPGRFAFMSYESGNADIYVMNPDRSGLRQLTTDPGDDRLPAWSPDGRRIVFTSDRTGEAEIWLMNADGSGQAQLTGTDLHGDSARWSPDGTQLVVAARSPLPDTLYVVALDGGGARVLLDPREHGLQWALNPSWALGDRISFSGSAGGNSDLYTVAADGSDLRQLTTTAGEEDGPASWSPDGRWAAFQSDHAGGCIYRIAADGSGMTRLTTGCGDDFVTAWSPDGTRIGWSGSPDGGTNIQVMNPDGTDQVMLTATYGFNELSWGTVP